jgi:hypothetical protein
MIFGLKLQHRMPKNDGNSQCSLLIVFPILHSHTLVCQDLGFYFHLLKTNVFLFFCLGFMEQGKDRSIYRLTMHCVLGLDCHEVGVVFMNMPSILLCFHPKHGFVMHHGNATLNPKLANLRVVCCSCMLCFFEVCTCIVLQCYV